MYCTYYITDTLHILAHSRSLFYLYRQPISSTLSVLSVQPQPPVFSQFSGSAPWPASRRMPTSSSTACGSRHSSTPIRSQSPCRWNSWWPPSVTTSRATRSLEACGLLECPSWWLAPGYTGVGVKCWVWMELCFGFSAAGIKHYMTIICKRVENPKVWGCVAATSAVVHPAVWCRGVSSVEGHEDRMFNWTPHVNMSDAATTESCEHVKK